MRHISFYPKHPVVRNTFDQIAMAHGPHGCGIRVSPETARRIWHLKPIIELSRADKIDIVGRKNGPKRSFIFVSPDIKVQKKGGEYHFFY